MRAKIMPVTKVRKDFLGLVQRMKKIGNEIIITADGEPAAVMMSFDDWESMMETMAVKSSPVMMKQIRESAKFLKRGGRGKRVDEIDWGEI